ncbi:MAG: hypothetical protein WA579_16480 [Rhodomicrobium sp.]
MTKRRASGFHQSRGLLRSFAIADGRKPIRDVVQSISAVKDFAASGAKLALVLLQAGDDLFRNRYKVFAKAKDVRLAGRLLLLRARFGHRTRSRKTKRRRYGNPRRIPHYQTPLMIG